MLLVADTHLHLYPCYKIVPALKNLMSVLHRFPKDVIALGFLAERHDCHYFQDISRGMLDNDFVVDKSGAGKGVLGIENGGKTLYLFAGRQVISSERIEILALTTDNQIPDGLPAREVVRTILGMGAIPVISWAPGKWFFKRKAVVRDLITTFSRNDFMIGDTSLRPTVWPKPQLMKYAEKKGFSIIYGSDPLPFSGEEEVMGRYCSIFHGEFNRLDPLESIRCLVKDPATTFGSHGMRCSLAETLQRLYKNNKSKRKSTL